jgi:putative ABC transport system permease protein
MRSWLMRLFGLFERTRREREFAEELESHLALHIADNLRAGMSSEEARRQARIKLGGVTLTQELHREQRGLPMLETLLQDLRFGQRMLMKKPGFTLIAVITLALGIGANTAIFSVVNGVLLSPLPYADPERLAMVWESGAKTGGEYEVRVQNFLSWRQQQQVFDQIAAFQYQDFNLTGGDQPERLQAVYVTANMFPLLGVQPALGRNFSPTEERFGQHRVVIISQDFRQRHLGAEANPLGKSVSLNGEPYEVIGVMPAGFEIVRGGGMRQGLEFNPRTDFWAPYPFKPEDQANIRRFFHIIGRLRADVTLPQAQSAMGTLARSLDRDHAPSESPEGVKLIALSEQVNGKVRPVLLVLFGAVGLVLLIACANVANLNLARAAARQREFAVRGALGASRGRLMRQVLTEGLLLSLLAGIGGMLLAYWLRHLIVAFSPDGLPRVREITIDNFVLGFTMLVSLLSGLLFSLAPALRFSNPNLHEAMKPGSRRVAFDLSRFNLSSLLVTAEIALSLVLLLGAGLLLNSFLRLYSVDPGFDTRNVLTMELSLPQTKYASGNQMENFHEQALRRIATLPGVEAAGMINFLPLGGRDFDFPAFTIDGLPATPEVAWDFNRIGVVSPDYFRAIGTPLVGGRFFNERDNEKSERVVIVNETAAGRYWQGRNPIGSRIRALNVLSFLVVGVVADVRHQGLESEADPRVYLPHTQVMERMKTSLLRSMTLVLRSASAPEPLIAGVRRQVGEVDRDQPLSNIRTMRQVVAASLAQRTFTTALLGAFASLALLLALIGIYGVMSNTVAQRTHEIGIRMALGAQKRDVLRLVIGQGMLLASLGVTIGLCSAFGLTRLMQRMLYGVSPTDLPTFAVIAAVLLFAALLACWLPARRATKVDPLIALRHE